MLRKSCGFLFVTFYFQRSLPELAPPDTKPVVHLQFSSNEVGLRKEIILIVKHTRPFP